MLLNPNFPAYLKLFKNKIIIRGIKLVLDGAIGTSTASFFKPYNDNTGQADPLINFVQAEKIIKK